MSRPSEGRSQWGSRCHQRGEGQSVMPRPSEGRGSMREVKVIRGARVNVGCKGHKRGEGQSGIQVPRPSDGRMSIRDIDAIRGAMVNEGCQGYQKGGRICSYHHLMLCNLKLKLKKAMKENKETLYYRKIMNRLDAEVEAVIDGMGFSIEINRWRITQAEK